MQSGSDAATITSNQDAPNALCDPLEPIASPALSKPPSSTEPALRDILPRPIDYKPVIVLVSASLMLTCCYYFGFIGRVSGMVLWLMQRCGVQDPDGLFRETFVRGPRSGLWRLYHWAGVHTLFYMIVPILIIKLLLRERVTDYGLKLTGWYKKLWIYAGAFAIVLPLVLLFGATESFQSKYPFYDNAGASWVDFLGWELAYALQFLALEFFFRGFLVHGLKDRFGCYSVVVMTVPYCMIHFGKPLPETIGAIIAGLFLGTLSLWTRSIWLGFMIHVSVALSMDIVALGYKGELRALLS